MPGPWHRACGGLGRGLEGMGQVTMGSRILLITTCGRGWPECAKGLGPQALRAMQLAQVHITGHSFASCLSSRTRRGVVTGRLQRQAGAVTPS